MEKDAPFHNSSDSNRVPSTLSFPFGYLFRRRVNLLMGHFLAFRGRYIKYASCPGYHLSSRNNGLPHPLAFLSPVSTVFIQSLRYARPSAYVPSPAIQNNGLIFYRYSGCARCAGPVRGCPAEHPSSDYKTFKWKRESPAQIWKYFCLGRVREQRGVIPVDRWSPLV